MDNGWDEQDYVCSARKQINTKSLHYYPSVSSSHQWSMDSHHQRLTNTNYWCVASDLKAMKILFLNEKDQIMCGLLLPNLEVTLSADVGAWTGAAWLSSIFGQSSRPLKGALVEMFTKEVLRLFLIVQLLKLILWNYFLQEEAVETMW